jgi:vacuolar protein sorting-associated protein 41
LANYIPTEPMVPPIESSAYEVVLGYYIQNDKPRFKELLQRWQTDLFNITAVTTHLENQLRFKEVREDSIDDGEKGRDWRIVMDSLASLHEANGRHREALRYYIMLQDANSAFRLIRDSHLADAVADDIPSFIGLRVSMEDANNMNQKELEEATSEAITLLIDEAQHGLVKPSTVVSQLLQKDLKLYIYFYLRGLWKGEGIKEHTGENRERVLMETKSMVDEFADLAVLLFAAYDRELLMDFLKTATSYAFEKVSNRRSTIRAGCD